MRYKQLIAKRAGLLEEAEGLEAKETLTEQEDARFSEILTELDALKPQITQAEAFREHQRNAPAGEPVLPENPNPAPAQAERVFETLGDQMAAIYTATISHGEEAVTARNKLMAAASGSNEAVDSEGGFAVQADFSTTIERRMNEVGTLLALMNPLQVSGNGLYERTIAETSRATGSRWGGIRGYWVAEGDSITDSKPKFERIKTELEKVAALGYSTDELLEDFAAMSGLFVEGFAEELTFLTEDAIIEGDGAGKPLGILNAPCLITQAKETGQAADTFNTANISQMWNRFPSRNRKNAVWLINQELEPQLDELSIPAGTAALEPRFVTYGPDGILRIKGRPVVVIEYASALGDLGDVILADPTEYRLITKGGVKQASSMHVKFATDEMAFRATYRVGGQPKWRLPLTPFKATASRTVSPFVTLAAR